MPSQAEQGDVLNHVVFFKLAIADWLMGIVQLHDQRTLEPVFALPFFQHVLKRGKADREQAGTEPVKMMY